MPTYYDEEEDPNVAGTDTEDFMPATPFYSQDQAAARDEVLSQGLPTAIASAPPPRVGPVGEATREYQTGRPGLFVQGGPSVPAGMIEVNGQLERSHAAPQPVPWWITAADQFKEEQRQRDFLQSLLAQTPKGQTNQAIERAMQLEGVLAFDADRKSGVPVQEALMRHAPKMYFKSPASVSRLEVGLARNRPAAQPFVPSVTDVGGQQLFQISPQRYSFGPRKATEKPQGLSPEGKLKALSMQLRDVQKQEEAASFSRDKTAMGKLADKRQKITDQIEKLQSGEQPAQAPSAPAQTQTSPRVALANQLAKDHPDWTKEKIIAEVRKQLK